MAKTSDARLNDTLAALGSVNQDAEYFCRYCLYHVDPAHLVWGGAYADVPHNKTALLGALGADLSFGYYVGGGADIKRKRSLRRALMLLKLVAGEIPLATTKTASSGQSVAQLEAAILSEWRSHKIGEVQKVQGRVCGMRA